MRYNPDIHHRKSIRLKGYDYSQSGLYFITICTYEGLKFFGEIENEKMILNEYGKIAEEEILKTQEIRKNIEIDRYCIMPNHLHMIIEMKREEKEEEKQGDPTDAPVQKKEEDNVGVMPVANPDIRNEKSGGKKLKKETIGAIIGQIKSITTKRINKLNNSKETVIWHRNYYENIIRNEEVYSKISEYIENNPKRWDDDKYYNK